MIMKSLASWRHEKFILRRRVQRDRTWIIPPMGTSRVLWKLSNMGDGGGWVRVAVVSGEQIRFLWFWEAEREVLRPNA
jgi:hypothetical protein